MLRVSFSAQHYSYDTNTSSSFSSLTTVTAFSFQSSMMCAEILDDQRYINIALVITAIHFTFTVRYMKFTNSVLSFKLFGKCNTQYTEKRM